METHKSIPDEVSQRMQKDEMRERMWWDTMMDFNHGDVKRKMKEAHEEDQYYPLK